MNNIFKSITNHDKIKNLYHYLLLSKETITEWLKKSKIKKNKFYFNILSQEINNFKS